MATHKERNAGRAKTWIAREDRKEQRKSGRDEGLDESVQSLPDGLSPETVDSAGPPAKRDS